jgi:hypothetical protein
MMESPRFLGNITKRFYPVIINSMHDTHRYVNRDFSNFPTFPGLGRCFAMNLLTVRVTCSKRRLHDPPQKIHKPQTITQVSLIRSTTVNNIPCTMHEGSKDNKRNETETEH